MTRLLVYADHLLAGAYALRSYFLIACVSLGLILSLQLVRHGHLFLGDDYIQLLTLEGTIQDFGSPPFELYDLMGGSAERLQRQMEKGPLPWWADPELKIRFFRPIGSALLTLDHAVFGHRMWGYRLHAIFWYLVLVVAYGLWVRRIIPVAPGDGQRWHPAAMLALLIYVVSDNYWLNIIWSAGRWVLVSTALTLLGCVFYERWRSEVWRPGLYLSVLMFTAGLLSGEVALAILAFPLAGEIFCPPRGGAGRFKGVALLSIVAIAYLAFYSVGGYGTQGSNVYLNPMDDASAYLAELPTRMLALAGEIFLWIPAIVVDLRAGVVGLALLAVLLIPAFRRGSPDTRSRLLALVTGVAASMLPLMSGDPNTRNLMVPMIGAAALVGIGLHFWWAILQGGTWHRWVALVVVSITCVIHLVIAPYRWFTRPASYEARATSIKEAVRRDRLIDASMRDKRVVFLAAGPMGSFYSEYFLRRLEGLPLAECWWLLSAERTEHVYHRTAANRLELETVGREVLAGGGGAIRSHNTPIHVGDRVRLKGLEVEILEVGTVGATRVGFTFDRSLDDPSLVFLAGPVGAVHKVHPPPMGGELRLPSPY